MRVMLDAGVFGAAQYADFVTGLNVVHVGPKAISVQHAGFLRRPPHPNSDYQAQKDAVCTIGRLLRQGKLLGFIYPELETELCRGSYRGGIGNALRACSFARLPSPIERSKLCSTSNIQDWFAKGGRKDRKAGVLLGKCNQISFLQALIDLKSTSISWMIAHSELFKLNSFEIESFHDLPWFQSLATESASKENWPDCFHIWAVKRNQVDVFITLERKLPEMIARLQRRGTWQSTVRVLRPLDVLAELGIGKSDPVPIEYGKVYSFSDRIECPE